jgi:hypothetical protein
VKGDACFAFGVRGLAFGVEDGRGKKRKGEWAIWRYGDTVPTAFEDEDDDDEYEDDGFPRGLA